MKTRILLTAILMSTCTVCALAYDFMTDGIAYNYLGSFVGDVTATNVEVTYVDFISTVNYNGTTNITIPSTVRNGYTNRTYNVIRIADWAFSRCQTLKTVSISSSVKSISKGAFYDCPALTTVNIPNSITSIGENAFSECTQLTSAVIPNSVTSLGESAFHNCRGMTTLTIGNSVPSIGATTFYGCKSLTTVTIPNSVKTIDLMAFSNCTGLTSVTLPNALTSLGDGVFSSCTSLTSVEVPNSVTTLGVGTFAHCSSLESATLPNTLTNLPEELFEECSSLISITIPSTVTAIGSEAFYHCSNLNAINSKIVNVGDVSMGSSVFVGVNKRTCTLTVPVGTVNAYKRAEQWKEFDRIIDEEGNTGGGDDPNPTELAFTPYAVNTPNNGNTNENEDYRWLFDKNKYTKWCVDNTTGEWDPIWVDFKCNMFLRPTKYTMTTANDTYGWKGRNPKKWKIYAKAQESDSWTTIVEVEDGEAAGLGTDNYTEYHFNINGVNKKYQYFRFEVIELRGRGGWQSDHYVFQLAELALDGESSVDAGVDGDVDGSGEVNGNDLNILINILLGKDNAANYDGRANVDGVGGVDGADINALINILLGK